MRGLSVITFFFLLLFLLFSPFYPFSLVFAQEATPSETKFDFNKAYQDYIYNYDLYLKAHKEYLVAKNQYETYQTLTSQTIALEQTLAMLRARDEVLATFLMAVRIKLADETNVASSKLNLLYLELDEEAQWFREHKETLTSAGSIPDLVELGNRAKPHQQKTDRLTYESLLEIFLYKEDFLHEKLQAQIDQVEEKIVEIRSRGDKDPSTIERWLLEAKNRKVRSDEKLKEARGINFSDRVSSGQNRARFNHGVSVIEQSHQYLKETNVALLEIIKEIKRGD